MKKLKRFKAYASYLKRGLTKKWSLYALRYHPQIRHAIQIINHPVFVRFYAIVAVAVLLLSTMFWSILGARLQQSNADQLVNPFLFEKPVTFHDALLPGSHSFFLKWPLFLLIKALGFTDNAYLVVTVLTVLATVSLLAFIMYRIERRPLVFGTLCLALASVLMLIPSQPYAGALLPVNMAMLATRNLEYLVYIAGVMLLTRARRIWSVKFLLGIIVLAILIASDKLFLSLTIGGALIALTIYGLASGWNMVSVAARWILAGLLSALGATGILWALNLKAVTHITTQAGVGPYGLVHNAHELALGVIYGVLGLLTNFGANPASQTTVLHDVPHQILQHLLTSAGPSYLLNLIIFCLGVFAAFRIIGLGLAHNKDRKMWLDNPSKLSDALVWTSVAALIVFVASNHYYAGDARYLTVTLFGLFLAGSTYISKQQWRQERFVLFGLLLIFGILLSIPSVLHTYYKSQLVTMPTNDRNARVAQALKLHPVKVLVGDYWRVVPIKSESHSTIPVQPLGSCTQPRDTLTSKQWQKDLTKNSFAYLLSLDGSLTDFPNCTLDQIIQAYGRPNASIVIAGNNASPKEILLFYDNGSHKSEPISKLPTPSTVLPVELDDLPYTACRAPTTMNIVAHEDDDLLFMNPDLSIDLKAGNCVRSVYVTAGDAGANAFYWLGREQGTQAAYAKMIHFDGIWIQRVVHISGDRYVTIASPRGNNKISLIFLRLPDGNMKGQGFGATRHESLASLDSGQVPTMHDVYNSSAYSADQLRDTLTALMEIYQPSEIRTQANFVSSAYPDHSDHMAVGRFTQKAYQKYEDEHFAGRVTIPMKYYIGYPVHQMPVNVFSTELNEKEDVFSAYGKFDGGVCHSILQCRRDSAYGAYLPRQYKSTY